MKRGPHPLASHLAIIWQRLNAAVDAARAMELAAGVRPEFRAEAAAIEAELAALGWTGFDAAVRAEGLDRIRAVLAGIRRYQDHPYRRALAEPPVLLTLGGVRVLDFGGCGPPALFVPSLINPSWILDLAEDNSLLRWLATQGVRPLLVDWGDPSDAERGFDLDAYIVERLSPLLDAIGTPVRLVGYCLGGLLATGLAALRPERVASLTAIATPWSFAGYAATVRQALADLWRDWRPVVEATGVLPMDALQLAFIGLDPTLTERKYRQFAQLDPASADARAFVALEDWANQGAAIAGPAGRQLVEAFYRDDEPGTGRWRLAGCPVDPGRLAMPGLVMVSTPDRIVPRAAASPLASTLRQGYSLAIPSGHVGMVAGGQARQNVWVPLARWLAAPDPGAPALQPA